MRADEQSAVRAALIIGVVEGISTSEEITAGRIADAVLASPGWPFIRDVERNRLLRSFENLAVAQELEAIAEPNPDVRRGMVAVIEMIRAVIEVEKR